MLFWKNFKWSDPKDQDEFRFKIRIFRKFIQFSSKVIFCALYPRGCTARQKNPLHTTLSYVAAWSAAYMTEMINDDPEKVLNLTLSCLFLSKMSWHFQHIAIFLLWEKAMPLLSPVSSVILWEIKNWKKKKTINATLKDHISKTRKNLKPKLEFLEIFSIFFKTALFSARFIYVGLWQKAPPPVAPCSTASVFQVWKRLKTIQISEYYLSFAQKWNFFW